MGEMEFRGRVILDGTKGAAADVATLRAELEAARGQLARIGQAAPAIGTIGQQAAAARSPWEQLAASSAKAQATLAAPGGKTPGFLAQAKGAAKDAKTFLGQAGAKLKGDTAGAASTAASKATGVVGAAGAALLAAAGVAGVASLTRLALGYRGVAQLQQLGVRAQFQFRQLFSGVNPAPVVRAADRFLQLFNKSSVEGKALSGILDRTFTGFFQTIEAAQPYASAFVDGMLLGALKVENAWLRGRIALFPITSALEEAAGGTVGLGLAAEAAQAPFRALAAIIDGIAASIKLVSDGYNALNTKVKRSYMSHDEQVRLGNQDRDEAAAREHGEESSRARGERQTYTKGADGKWTKMGRDEQDFGPSSATAAPPSAAATARPAGQATGAEYAAGVVQGLNDGTPAVAAAARAMAGHVDASTRTAGQIQSPSRLLRKTARNFPAGLALGIDDGADDVQAAAARSLVPRPAAPGGPSAGGGGARGPAALPPVTIINQWPEGVGTARRQELEDAAAAGYARAMRAFALGLGVSVELAA